MNIAVVSNYFIVSMSLSNMLDKYLNISEEDVKSFESLHEIKDEEVVGIDYILLYITKDNVKELEAIDRLKLKNPELRVVIIEIQKDENIFMLSMKRDVDSYISNISDGDDFKYIMNKIMEGNKYYESELVKIAMRKEKENKTIGLTKREKEVLMKISEGYSNKEISQQLYIAESTTKRHISNLFNKLNLKNRSEVISYVHKNSMYF